MKKVIAVLLSVMLIFTSFAFINTTALAEEDEGCVITFASVPGHPGDTVNVPVYISNNPGIAGINIALDLQEKLTCNLERDVENGSLFSGFKAGYSIVLDSVSNVTTDGLLMTVRITIDDAAAYQGYTVSGEVLSCFNDRFTNIDYTVVPGTITVTDDRVYPTSITLDKTDVTIRAGESVDLSASFLPIDTTETALVWKTTDYTVATVSNGVVTGVSIGTARIVVKARFTAQPTVGPPTAQGMTGLPFIPFNNEVTATCYVTVTCGHESVTTVRENEVLPTADDDGGYDEISYCDDCGEIASSRHVVVPATGAHQNFGNITTDGFIAVNTYLDLSAYNLKNPKVVIESVAVDDTIQTDVYVKPTPIGEGRFANYYFFTVSIAAHNMVKDINITLYDNESIVSQFADGGVYTTTVRDLNEQYIEYYSEGGAGASDPKAEQIVELCKTYLAYGARAQTYFLIDVDNLADQNYSIADRVEAVKSTDIHETRVITGKATGFKITKASFMVTSKSSIRYYYDLTDAEISDYTFTATLDGVAAKVRTGINTANERPYVEIYDIAAKDYDAVTILNVTRKSDSTTTSVSYNAMCYAKGIMEAAVVNPDSIMLCKAMYLYNQAANAYFDNLD